MRIEKDALGELSIPEDKLWGIHTERARNNFSLSGIKVPSRLVYALAQVKKACCLANYELGFLPEFIYHSVNQACDEVADGLHIEHFPLDAIQGGAGTSTNMNINEVLANRALQITGKEIGAYYAIHPIEHINLHQSTNDVYPTALKIAAIYAIRELSETAAKLQGELQKKEKEFADVLIPGRTEMQSAAPITLGGQFASFAEAIARDRWRVYKCEERLRIVNIGGTAVGTGLTAPRSYIFLVIEKLRAITGLGLARAEQTMDQTANTDSIVEVSGILNAMAVNLSKIASDLRLLHFTEEIKLPAVQSGSTIMPGKVNPVISEAIISASIKALSNDKIISECSSRGSLQINEFMPLMAFAFIESLEILINAVKMLTLQIPSIIADRKICKTHFEENDMIVTAFLPIIGYERSEQVLEEFKNSNEKNFKIFLSGKFGEDLVNEILTPENLMSLGYRKTSV